MDQFPYKDEKPELSEEEIKEIQNIKRTPRKISNSREGFLEYIQSRKYNILDEYRKRSVYVMQYKDDKKAIPHDDYVNKIDIIREAAKKLEVGYGELSVATDAFFDTIMEKLVQGKSVRIRGFGMFKLSPERTHSHKSNYYKHISYRRKHVQDVRFIPSKILKRAISNEGGKEYFWTKTGEPIHDFANRSPEYAYLAKRNLYNYAVVLNHRGKKKKNENSK